MDLSKDLYDLLYKQADADRQKGILSLKLLSELPVGIGDHSTEDFYNNANDALKMIASADERIETLHKLLDSGEVFK
tara:strand:+ start:197 stop:427 length:231 start_codon:yes stop_codon:yes gene_type:complete